jgi:Tol biopolymer transport system component
MTTNDEFERQLAGWLTEDSRGRVPDHLDEVLLRTAATRQRAWWSSLRRWLPMDIPAPRVPPIRTGSLRAFAVLTVVALVIAALLLVVVGSQRRLPPPFGLARNGALVASANGDIFSIDPATGRSTPLISDPASDFGPGFSRDGTKIMFLRQADPVVASAGLELVVANADGTGARVITPGVDGLDWADWSPDGSRIAYLSHPPGMDGHRINVVNVDGSAPPRPLDVGQPANQISWLPPDGKEILFRGEHLIDSDPPAAIFVIGPDGTGLRQVSTRPATDQNDYQDVAVSPDGNRLAYRDVSLEQRFRIHTLDLRTGADRALPELAGETGQGGPMFSPDGRSIVYLSWAADTSTQLTVGRADGTGPRVPIGPRAPFGPDGPTINNYGFVPDGTAVYANYDAEKVARLLPVDGSPGTVLASGDLAFLAYQRLAP